MAFIARVDKPCSHCGVVIPKGSSGGFTWDRTKGGFIHLECMKARKEGGAGNLPPSAYCLECGIRGHADTCSRRGAAEREYTCTYPGCGVTSPDMEQLRLHSLDKHQGKKCHWCGVDEALPWKDHYSTCHARKTFEGAADPLGAAVAIEPVIEAPKKQSGKDTGAQLAALIQSLAGARGIDEEAVRKIAADEASKVSTNRSITIKVGEIPEIKLDLAHKDLPLLVRLVSAYGANGHRQNIYMHGPAGSGKSTAARQTSDALKLTYGYISLNPQTPDSRLLGYMHAGGEYVPSEFFRRYTEGGVFCIDEIDNAAASLVTTLNGLLENGHGAFPHGVFERHKDFVCVCTANTIGRGGDVNYPERRALDGAFLERFIFLQWGYDTDLTKAIVTGILGAAASEFISWVKREAETLQSRYPTLIVSPRAFIQGAALEKLGISRNEIVPMVISRGL